MSITVCPLRGLLLFDQNTIGTGFSKIFRFLERILMDHIEMKNSLESMLQIDLICSIGIRSRNKDIFEKPSNPHVIKNS